MKKKRWIIGLVLTAAVALVVGTLMLPMLMGGYEQGVQARPMTIQTVASLRGSDAQLVSGSVHTAESENFYVDASKGRVSEIKVAQGAQVRKGDELYVYSNPSLTIGQEKTRIQLETAKRKLPTLETALANINRDLKRAPGTEAAAELRTQRDQAREAVEAARTEIRMAELDIEEANDQVAALTVRANFDGTVEMVNEDERNAVAQGAATKPLIRLVSSLPYEVRGSLTELQRAQIKQDMPFIATSKALPGQKWRGAITYVSTFPMEAAGGQGGDNAGQAQYEFVAKLETQENLVPGNTLFLEVSAAGAPESFTLPVEAVQRGEGGSYVFIVENGRLVRHPVEVGDPTEGEVTVTSPMEDDTEVLLNPEPTTTEGTEVVR
ncbi:MAG: efflux RND transporter periplasmic adaptor subunit [Propionibacteriaceae bacterium]|nr:efflux RND transporter periplasmic adaptor subunit [Propionibacteriaceae bacterium]